MHYRRRSSAPAGSRHGCWGPASTRTPTTARRTPSARASRRVCRASSTPARWRSSPGNASLRDALPAHTVLTPHAGELARLLTGVRGGREVERADVEARPLAAAREVVAATGATVLVKGATTSSSPPAGPVRSSVPRARVAGHRGAGDVLAGILGTLLAAGLEPADAAALAADVHGRAATWASRGGDGDARATRVTCAGRAARSWRATSPGPSPLSSGRCWAVAPERLRPMTLTAPDSAEARAALRTQLPPGLLACAVVDLDAVAGQRRRRCASTRPGGQLMAVVKADGYGHGMVPVARAALAGGATWLGVAHLREALAAAAGRRSTRRCCLAHGARGALAEAVAAGVEVGVSAVGALAESPPRRRRRAAGPGPPQGRHRAVPQRLPARLTGTTSSAAAARLQAEGRVEMVGVWSPLRLRRRARAPERARAARSVRRGARGGRAGRPAARAPAPRELGGHAARSRGALRRRPARDRRVRPLARARAGGAAELGLRPAMTLLARVAMVKRRAGRRRRLLRPHLHHRDARPRLALVPVGYGDGVPRQASGTGPVLSADAACRWPAASAWTRSWSTSAPTPRSPIGDVAVLFGDAGDGRADRARTGPRRPGRSTTRS